MEVDGFWEHLFFSQKPFFNYLGIAYILGFVGFACMLVGIIGESMGRVLGLQPISWFLVGIWLIVMGIWFWLEWSFLKRSHKTH
jgi:putative Mn2+ efflux pump MntP